MRQTLFMVYFLWIVVRYLFNASNALHLYNYQKIIHSGYFKYVYTLHKRINTIYTLWAIYYAVIKKQRSLLNKWNKNSGAGYTNRTSDSFCFGYLTLEVSGKAWGITPTTKKNNWPSYSTTNIYIYIYTNVMCYVYIRVACITAEITIYVYIERCIANPPDDPKLH